MEDTEIWSEKYRPSDFNEVKGQDKIIERVKSMVENKNLPHLLFAGPAGTGKSSLAILIAKKLFKDDWRQNFLELNASNERGIQVVRETIKDFARTRSINTEIPKIIFLDEADALTKEAQQALRRTMESYSNVTRFILACNISSKIIDPIQSRCAIFRFKQVEKEYAKKVVEKIIKNEGLKIENEAIEAIYNVTNGDIRRAINILQSCAVVSKNISEELIYDIASAARPKEIKEALEFAVSGNFLKAREHLLNTMLKYGLNGLDVIKQIRKEIWNINVDERRKIELIDKCGEIEFRMVEGSDEFIQLEALLVNFAKK